jgi:hypothetical protein
MEKHLELTIAETSFTYACREENIKVEAPLDGLYVIRSRPYSSTIPVLGCVGFIAELKGRVALL